MGAVDETGNWDIVVNDDRPNSTRRSSRRLCFAARHLRILPPFDAPNHRKKIAGLECRTNRPPSRTDEPPTNCPIAEQRPRVIISRSLVSQLPNVYLDACAILGRRPNTCPISSMSSHEDMYTFTAAAVLRIMRHSGAVSDGMAWRDLDLQWCQVRWAAIAEGWHNWVRFLLAYPPPFERRRRVSGWQRLPGILSAATLLRLGFLTEKGFGSRSDAPHGAGHWRSSSKNG